MSETRVHGLSCNCDRCVGLRRYPTATMCDWCKEVHAGDANNCYAEDEVGGFDFPPDPIEVEKFCWEVITDVKSITERAKMIPQKQGNSQAPQGGRPTNRPRTGLPYLGPDNQTEYLTEDNKGVKIINCKVDKINNATVLILRLAIDGKSVLWRVRQSNPCWDILVSLFGHNENDWIGKTIGMHLYTDPVTEQVWANVDPSYKSPKSK